MNAQLMHAAPSFGSGYVLIRRVKNTPFFQSVQPSLLCNEVLSLSLSGKTLSFDYFLGRFPRLGTMLK